MERRDFFKVAAGAAALLAVPSITSAAPQDYAGVQRTVEVYSKGKWRKGTWKGLKKDDIFRLRDPDGSIVDEHTDCEVCVAVGDAYPVAGDAICGVEGEQFTFIDQSHVLASRLRVVKDGVQVGLVRMVDMKRGLMHRFQRQAELPLADQPTLVLVAEAETFDYVELRPE